MFPKFHMAKMTVISENSYVILYIFVDTMYVFMDNITGTPIGKLTLI